MTINTAQPGARPPERHAVVIGALGVIGRYIVDRLAREPGWRVTGLSRRSAEDRPGVRYLSVDLLNPEATRAALADLKDVTHVFFAGFQAASGPAAGYASNIKANLDLLVNPVSVLDRVAPRLQRVVLVTGTKYYGTHLGPFRTPARETDPRHLPPNYYFDQIDWLTAFQRGKAWDWTELRPQTLCGFAPGTPMSIVPVIAVYAAICKEFGLPLRFPGKPGAWTSLYQVTESAHFAQAARWAATEPRCANQAYNITNGDSFRWCNLWPRLAEVFEMPWAEPQTISLTAQMADKAPLWEAMVRRHGLQPYAFEQIAAWPFGDYVFASDWDVLSNLTKSRQHGFHEVVDSEEMFVRLLGQFRRERIVP